MSAPTPLPTHVYKILDARPEDPLPASLPVSELDEKDGFVHLSTAAQVSLSRGPLPALPTLLALFVGGHVRQESLLPTRS